MEEEVLHDVETHSQFLNFLEHYLQETGNYLEFHSLRVNFFAHETIVSLWLVGIVEVDIPEEQQ